MLGLFFVTNANAVDNTYPSKTAIATFAGGCFWCMEAPFESLPGVLTTTSGYTGGHTVNPTYKEVSKGLTGHNEAVQAVFDPDKVNYETLLDVFWHNIDPFNDSGQFCDKGNQYQAVIFFQGEEQRQLVEASKANLALKFKGKTVVTSILPAKEFYPAEDYHQNYYKHNPIRYKVYRNLCKRDGRLQQIWGK